jgi:hypothetical protein
LSPLDEAHLRVYRDRSEFHDGTGTWTVFLEGGQSTETKRRYRQICQQLEDGFLDQQILYCREPGNIDLSLLDPEMAATIRALFESVTSEVGRAIVGLSVLQLCVKAICPEQSIRLHKSGNGFGWVDGISMRTLDRRFITPTLRGHDLLRMNRDGFMMTRSLAENYPYSILYKASLRGARSQWLELVEYLESGALNPLLGLHYLLAGLLNRAAELEVLGDSVMHQVELLNTDEPVSEELVTQVITSHIHGSDYPARLMELAMHSLLLSMAEANELDDRELRPLGQMRSANKKHGNVGDVELEVDGLLVEAWDAKFGKSDLRDEFEELSEKLEGHQEIRTAGFVITETLRNETQQRERAQDIGALHNVDIRVEGLDIWIRERIEGCATPSAIKSRWLYWYALALAQRNPIDAPMDEPTIQWLAELGEILSECSRVKRS